MVEDGKDIDLLGDLEERRRRRKEAKKASETKAQKKSGKDLDLDDVWQ